MLYKIEKLEQPVRLCGDLFRWFVRTLYSKDGGKTYLSTDYGVYCRTENEALNTAAALYRRDS